MSTSRLVTADQSLHRSSFVETLIKVTGTIRHPLESWKWLQLLKTHPLLSQMAAICPTLPLKIHRRYLSHRLGCAQRAAWLETHYDVILTCGFGELAKQAAVQPIPLCVFISKSNIFYRLELSAAGDASNTGEMILRLTSRGFCIYTVAFVFSMHQGRRSVTVGSLTGMLRTGGSTDIRSVTKDLHGCRPKDLMISLVREIGAFFYCEKTVLIGNRNKLRDRSKRVCRKSSDYDRIWKDLNASERTDGDFELPCTVRMTDAATLGAARTPTKRSVLINSIHSALRRRLNAERADPMPSEATFKMSA
jgi:uncharacterized protein VirK/YbjX